MLAIDVWEEFRVSKTWRHLWRCSRYSKLLCRTVRIFQNLWILAWFIRRWHGVGLWKVFLSQYLILGFENFTFKKLWRTNWGSHPPQGKTWGERELPVHELFDLSLSAWAFILEDSDIKAETRKCVSVCYSWQTWSRLFLHISYIGASPVTPPN